MELFKKEEDSLNIDLSQLCQSSSESIFMRAMQNLCRRGINRSAKSSLYKFSGR